MFLKISRNFGYIVYLNINFKYRMIKFFCKFLCLNVEGIENLSNFIVLL